MFTYENRNNKKRSLSSAILTKFATSWTHLACVEAINMKSWANLFLLFIEKEWSNLAVPWEAQIKSKESISDAKYL